MNSPCRSLLPCIIHYSLSIINCASAQQNLSLDQALNIVQTTAPVAQEARNRYANQFWAFRSYRANYRPQLRLDAVLPEFNRSIDRVTQPDGTISYREFSYANTSAALSLNQNVSLTGGSIFVSSLLQRLDNFSFSQETYQANPFLVGFNQPLFQFNELRFDRKLQPLLLSEAQKRFSQDLETAALRMTGLFFDVMLAQTDATLARQNLAGSDTLLFIARGRYELGKIAENDLLQLELSQMRARQDLAQAQLQEQQSTLSLRALLGLADTGQVRLMMPDLPPTLIVIDTQALAEAQANRPSPIEFQRQQLQAEGELSRAYAQTGFTGNFSGSFGLTQSTVLLRDVYQNPQDQQRVNLSFSVPIVDWGRRRSRLRTAQANLDLVKTQVAQQHIQFRQEVLLAVRQARITQTQLELARKGQLIGQKRFDVTRNRYLVGKIDITELNLAQREKDDARRSYTQALRNFWVDYFSLRRLTLFDFATGRRIWHDAKI